MKNSTIALLDRINREFYQHSADAFDRTRSEPWPGWDRLLDSIETAGQRPVILDVGCGNSRFLRTLSGKYGAGLGYLGVDSSFSLLDRAQAKSRGGSDHRLQWLVVDLVRDGLGAIRDRVRFDLVVVFGVMHHLPSFELRRRTLEEAGNRVRPEGFLAVSFWQFGERERFRKRSVPWTAWVETTRSELDLSDLEKEDHLLPWGDGESVRYCHFADEREARKLVTFEHMEVTASFRADGRSEDLNLYYLLQSTRSPAAPK